MKDHAQLIALLDQAIVLGEDLNRCIDGFEVFMKGSTCCNTPVSSGARKLQ